MLGRAFFPIKKPVLTRQTTSICSCLSPRSAYFYEFPPTSNGKYTFILLSMSFLFAHFYVRSFIQFFFSLECVARNCLHIFPIIAYLLVALHGSQPHFKKGRRRCLWTGIWPKYAIANLNKLHKWNNIPIIIYANVLDVD